MSQFRLVATLLPIPLFSRRTTMRPISMLLLIIFCVALAMPAVAEERAVTPTPAPEVGEAPRHPVFLELPLEDLPPHLRAIREVLDERAAALTELEARYEAATSDTQALEIQREMHELKRDTELELLNAQLDVARLEGNVDKVEELEFILETIESREGVLGPAVRAGSELRESQ